MENLYEICPCPNVKCPNRGNCAKCISRHLNRGYLNYCSFHTVLPMLRKVCEADPASQTAKQLSELLDKTLDTYDKLMKHNGVTSEECNERLKKVAALCEDSSDHSL